jgi:YD repeat-containing protein
MRYTNETEDPIAFERVTSLYGMNMIPATGIVNSGDSVDVEVDFYWITSNYPFGVGWPPPVTTTFYETYGLIDILTGNQLGGYVDQFTGEPLDGSVHISFVPPNFTVSPESIDVEVIEGRETVPTGATLTITHTENNIGCHTDEVELGYCPLKVEFSGNIGIIYPSVYDLPSIHGGRGVQRGESEEIPVYARTVNNSPGTHTGELYIDSGDTRVTVPVTVRVVSSTCVDEDGDGYFGNSADLCPDGRDCNDDPADPNAILIYPGAEELCDDIDNDCDDVTDEGCCPQGFEDCDEETNADLGEPDESIEDDGFGESCGAPAWGVNKISLNHFMTDTPLWLNSPIGPSIGITLSYNSKDDTSGKGPFGNKWVFNYGGRIEEAPGGEVTVHMHDGAKRVYTPNGQGGYIAPQGKFATLVKNGDDDFELRFLDDSVNVYKIPPDTNAPQPFLVEIRDTYGQKLSFGYNPWGNLTTVTDALGRDTTLVYNAYNRVEIVTDPFGRSANFEYTGGNLTKITDMGGYWTSFAYDQKGNISGMTNERGTWSFDTDTPTGYTPYEHLSYSPPGGVMSNKYRITVTDPHGGKEEYYYTSRDNPGDELSTWYVSPNDYVEYESQSVNNLTSAAKTRYIIPERTLQNDVIEKIYYPNAVEAEASFDSFEYYQTNAKIANSIDIHDHQTQYTYNDKGRVTSITYPDSETTTYTYYPNDVDVQTVLTGLGTVSFTYNSNHDITSATDMEGITTNFTYNSYGQVTTVTSAVGTADASTTEFIFNTTTHLMTEKRVNNNTVATYTHDNIGRVKTATDASGITITYDYDDLDQVTKVTYPDGKFEEYTYATCCPGQIESMTDRSGRTTYLTYDDLKRLTFVNSPGQDTGYEYDDNGNVVKLTDSNNNETHFEYDRLKVRNA